MLPLFYSNAEKKLALSLSHIELKSAFDDLEEQLKYSYFVGINCELKNVKRKYKLYYKAICFQNTKRYAKKIDKK